MTDIPTDAKLTVLELTQSLYSNDHLILDSNRNLVCNNVTCSKLICDQIINAVDAAESTTSRNLPNQPVGIPNGIARHLETIDASSLNECHGEHSRILAGSVNEVQGSNSAILAGSDNQCYGNHSVCAGVNAVAEHDHSFVWNSDPFHFTNTTQNQQFVVNARNGFFFRLPPSQTVWNEHLQDGMACLCWDHHAKSLCLKTNQNGHFYKSFFPTQSNEIAIALQANNSSNAVSLSLHNPDSR